MKNKKIIILGVFLMLLVGYQVKAAANINDPGKVLFSINNKTYNNEAVYNAMYDAKGFQSMLNKLDNKYFGQKYAHDSRLAEHKEDKIKLINANKDKLSNFRLYNAKNINEYLARSNEMTNVYRELASIDGAYDKIYNKSDIDYIYQNKISGTAKISHILITVNPDSTEIDSTKALNEARNKALEVIEKVKKGQTFVDAVIENNRGNNKAGFLGLYNVDTAKGAELDQNLITAAFKLKDKEVSEPIETSHGYEIVYAEYTEPKPTFEQAKNEIAQKLWDIYSAQNPFFKAYALVKAREIAGLNIDDPSFKSQYANTLLQTKAQYVQYNPNPNVQPGLQ